MIQISEILSGIRQRSVLGSFLYLSYITDLLADTNVSIITFADNMAELEIHKDLNAAFKYLQSNLNLIQDFDGSKSTKTSQFILHSLCALQPILLSI